MTLKYINANILSAKSGILMHGVNCRGTMGAGLARQLREKFPAIYKAYMSENVGAEMLGTVQFVEIGQFVKDKPPLIVANCWTQVLFGMKPPYDGAKQHANYPAIEECAIKVVQKAIDDNTSVHVPMWLGCGLAGGDPAVVSKIFDDVTNKMLFKALYVWDNKI